MALVCGETYLQLVGKMKLYQFTVYEDKIGICAFCLYSSNLSFQKSSYFYLHQDMLHDEKSC